MIYIHPELTKETNTDKWPFRWYLWMWHTEAIMLHSSTQIVHAANPLGLLPYRAAQLILLESLNDVHTHSALLCSFCTVGTKWAHMELIVCVCPHVSTREPLNWFRWNLVWTLCHGNLPGTRTFSFPTVNNTNMMHARTCEVRATLALLDIKCCNYVW
jgi:hypothetical protein